MSFKLNNFLAVGIQMKKRFSIALLCLVLLIFFKSGLLLAQNQEAVFDKKISGLEEGLITGIIDGDTIKLADGRTVRLIGLDTPELNPPDGPIEYYGLQAKRYTKEKLLGEKVYLEYDKQKMDEYHRSLAYIYLADKTLFNAQLLKQGYGHLLTIAPNIKYEKLLQKQVQIARNKDRGIWEERRNLEIPIISWQEAGDYIRERVVVTGKVADTYDAGEVTFLNFAQDYNDTFSVVIFKSDEYKFSVEAEDYFLGQEVWLRGKVKEHQGASEMIIEEPTQIKIDD
mgnify:FL=1